MKAVLMDSFGGAEVLRVGEVPKPTPKPNEVLIQVAFASVNPVDWKIREGYLKEMLPHEFPIIPGWDAAGVVAEIGSNVRDLKVGERVYSYCRKPEVKWGTYAEYVTMDASAVSAIPDRLTLAEAASIPLVGLTAWQALYDFAGLKPKQSILIHGAAGGVGGLAIQFAKQTGATVYATASQKNLAYLKELGATRPIDYTKENVADIIYKDCPEGVDVVFDCVGGETLSQSYDLVANGGVLVSIVENPNLELAKKRGIKSGYMFVAPNGRQLREIATLIADRKVIPLPLEEMPLEKAAEAQEKNRGRHVRGKLVLKVG